MKNINFNKALLTVIILISLFSNSHSSLYFPLKIGNKFIFHYYYSAYSPYGNTSGPYDYVCRITKDTVINNKNYFYVQKYDPYSYSNYWFRVDTLTGSLYRYDPTNSCIYYYYETLVDSLFMPLGGISNSCNEIRLDSIKNVTKWNVSCIEKRYFKLIFGMSVTQTTRIYNSFFGSVGRFYSQSGSGAGHSESMTLKGCIIDSVMYGDTTLINVLNISTEVPDKFTLSQNYPNPFNPETKIRFSIPVCHSSESWNPGNTGVGLVTLKVFDALGREVETLVNEALQPGTYEVSFNGSKINSGVYFYRFITDGFTETKRMLLIK